MAGRVTPVLLCAFALGAANGLRTPVSPLTGRGQPAMALDGRRALLTSALLTALALPAGAASFAERADASLESIRAAETGSDLAQGLYGIGGLSDEYGGLGERTQDVVQKLRTLKTSTLWNAEVEIAYREVMRSVDPFRVVAVQPALQATVFAYAPVYVGLIVTQQVLPKFFPPAYAIAALLLFGPVLLAVNNS
ncbi:hypothetical protein T492DRAFT_1096027 [Pavlovales sp. CCMP2436]|nr:hypothetical protein T492DRAFT_1096027 [Pavlovales sp. CCMP2436]